MSGRTRRGGGCGEDTSRRGRRRARGALSTSNDVSLRSRKTLRVGKNPRNRIQESPRVTDRLRSRGCQMARNPKVERTFEFRAVFSGFGVSDAVARDVVATPPDDTAHRTVRLEP